ncbi:MAG: NADH-quinone oxidoreductase subunit L [Myxococcota bacterium]
MVNDGNQELLLRWIPLLPLAAAVIHGLLLVVVRRPVHRLVTVTLSCGAAALSFLIACAVFGQLVQMPEGGRLLADDLYTWIGAGVGSRAFSAEFGLVLDPLSAVMLLVVTGVGSLIHFYSIGYMEEDDRDDKGFQRFFCYLNLFLFSMLVLVLADNLVLMFLGWEGVGLCSYLLIGFWYSDRYNAYCGSKAFIVNRIGDLGFLIGIFLLFRALAEAGTPTVAFADIERHFERIAAVTVTVPAWLPFGPEWLLVNVVGGCFFLGACGKSAQLPLYTWLPDAMAGPTPVSALIHAATMVTAGVYMVCRLSFLYTAAPEISALIAWVGAITAIFAALIAVTQTDIKKVLAYSTVSQLGYMFLAVGCGAYSAAIFHLGTHAFFKALLFLGAGSVILAMHHEQDMEKMGGLRRRIPRTRWTFLIGTATIAGFPPFSGFFSKDEILLSVYTAAVPGHQWLYAIALATVGLTAFYIFRLYFRVFRGKSRVPLEFRRQMEDPPGIVIVPLYILSFFAVVAGFVGLPQAYGDHLLGGIENSNSLANFLAPVLVSGASHEVAEGVEYWLALLAVGVALQGSALAWWLYLRRPAWPAKIADVLAFPYRILVRKFCVDEITDFLLVRPLVAVSSRLLYRGIDVRLIDSGLVHGLAGGVRALAANGLRHAQSGYSQTYLILMVVGAVAIVAYLTR